jgi:hypothetical protein
MDKPQLEAFLTTLDRWTAFFTALVVIGVGGELVTHLLYSRTNKQLMAIQHQEEQEFQSQIALANERTAIVEKENLEIKRRMADRFLTNGERQSIVNGLSPYAGHQIAVVTMPDSEANDYGNSFISAFQEARWGVQHIHVATHGSSATPRGLTLKLSPHPDAGVKTLMATLQKLGMSIKFEEVETREDTFAELTVGIRP